MAASIEPSNEVAVVPLDLARTIVDHASYTDDAIIYPALAQLRETVPFGMASIPDYDPFWIATKHADVLAISRDAKTFQNADNNLILNTQAADAFLRETNGGKLRSMNSLPFLDRPEHGAYRNITATQFMRGRVQKLDPIMRAIAERTVDEFLATGGECDFVPNLAERYPLRVISALLGIPESDQPLILALTKKMFNGLPDDVGGGLPSPTAAAEVWRGALADFYDYFRHLAADRRRSPQDDLISVIANARIDDGPLIESYELDYYVAAATAGHDTTMLSISGGMLGLIRFPEQFAALKEDAGLTPGFVDEGIRMSVPVRHFMRTATDDIHIRGQRVQTGDRVFMSYPAANRDPEVFPNPDAMDIRRPNADRHLSFGTGPHMCLGQHVAILDMRILYETLMPRLASIELAGNPQYSVTNFIGGLSSLPVRFRAA